MKNKNQKQELKKLSMKELQSIYGGNNVKWIRINGILVCIKY